MECNGERLLRCFIVSQLLFTACLSVSPTSCRFFLFGRSPVVSSSCGIVFRLLSVPLSPTCAVSIYLWGSLFLPDACLFFCRCFVFYFSSGWCSRCCFVFQLLTGRSASVSFSLGLPFPFVVPHGSDRLAVRRP